MYHGFSTLYRVELLHREIPVICTGKGFAVRDCKEVKTIMIHEKKFCGFAKQLLLHANERLRAGRILHSICTIAKVLDGISEREGRANREFSKKNSS